jgi:hypothetical protein
MNMGRSALMIFACVCCLLIFTERTVKPAFGAQRITTKEQASTVVARKPVKPLPEQTQKSARKIASPTELKRPTKAIQESPRQESPTDLKPRPPKSRLQVKVRKTVLPKAVVQPRADLMYYGVLEDPQRYDPRPNPHTAGVPNPQTPDLTHDHFQELDRNQDGKIDPVERAFGRLDMDRDLHNRQLQ